MRMDFSGFLLRPALGRHPARRLSSGTDRLHPQHRRLHVGNHPRRHRLGAEGAVGGGLFDRNDLARRCTAPLCRRPARVAVPPLSNTFISLVKDTSLAAAITVPEMFRAAQRIVATSYEPLILYVEAAIIYLVVSSLLSALQARLEKRLRR